MTGEYDPIALEKALEWNLIKPHEEGYTPTHKFTEIYTGLYNIYGKLSEENDEVLSDEADRKAIQYTVEGIGREEGASEEDVELVIECLTSILNSQ